MAHPDDTLYDRRWAGGLNSALWCAAVLLALLFLVDRIAGALTAARGALWGAAAVLLFLVLCPARVSAATGWLAVRRLLRTRRVRTDRLVSVRLVDGFSQRLVLRDAFGGRVDIDPQILIDNPDLWQRLAEDARTSAASGSLLCGATALRRLAEHVERETALTVFKVSGLE